ncbi:manganese-dependent inorganic pyrophosphatase [Sulfurospirillum sp. 1612]|uniref:manganese-dependent inorganic pyrophosphatase n=1 Tax=Sulfurospirillum sp. 1612 TaxID=3094835 RepID=UPI002F91E326
MATYACGHINPDSDSICSAIALSYLKTQLKEPCIPARQGELNPETEFILNKFGFEKPVLKTEFAGENLYIVDYSNSLEAPKDVKEATIKGIIDHHKLGDLTTSTPLECWIRPVGCTNTIIKEMYDYHQVEIPKDIAGIMCCAILSDTVIFKSPTCTKIDTKACKALAKIAGIEDVRALGMELFIAKSAIKGATPRDLIKRDFKDFEMHGHKVGIGQLEVVDLSTFDAMKEDLLADMKALKEEGDRHTVILLLTDILKEGSQLLCVSDDATIIENAFGATLQDSQVWLPKVLSRKKQVTPPLEAAFNQ